MTFTNIRFFGDSDRVLRVTKDHPLLVVTRERASYSNKNFPLTWKPAADVQAGDYLAIPVPQLELEKMAAGITISFGHGRHQPVDHVVEFPQEPSFYRLLGYYFSRRSCR